MEHLKIFYDNYVLIPRNWILYDEDQVKCNDSIIRAPKTIVQLTLSLHELSSLFKYIDNKQIIKCLEQIKKMKLTRKKRQNKLLEFIRYTGKSFRQINLVKNNKIFNISKDPYQYIMINDHKFLISHFERLIYQDKPTEFKIISEFKY